MQDLGSIWFDEMESDRNGMKARMRFEWNEVGIIKSHSNVWFVYKNELGME